VLRFHVQLNLRVDITGDWFRDPWGWPEYDYVLDGHLDQLGARARATGTRRVAKIDVPKENFGIRPAVVLDPIDRMLFQGLVDMNTSKLIGKLSPWVHGWRLRREDPKSGDYSPNDVEWGLHRGQLKISALFCDFGLKTDIVSCFASIPVDRVCEDVERGAGSGDATGRLIDMLMSYDQVPGRSGLPQRCMASAALANMYLERLSHVLEDYSLANPSGFASEYVDSFVTRWMDDIWAFGDDDSNLRALQIDLQAAAREAGLEVNLGKTKLLGEDDLWIDVNEIEHSGIDAAIDNDPPDMEPLEHLLDQVIDSPESTDRTTIRFAMTRMRRQHVESRLDGLVNTAHRMPHGADHLARAFRDFGLWRTHADWYIEYSDGPLNRIGWSVAALGTMFPNKPHPPRIVIDRFARFLSERSSLPMLALGAQRLSEWDPRQARDLLHDLAERADHPHERRIIGLAATAARSEKSFIRRLLSEYEENRLTLALLSERDFKKVTPAPDFGAD